VSKSEYINTKIEFITERRWVIESFKTELKKLVNEHSVENICDMPDFLLAEMICDLIVAIGSSSKRNLDWHGCNSVCHPKTQGEECTK